MNTYTTTFWARCPANDVPIQYRLQIRTHTMIRVEEILEFTDGIKSGFHEEIADQIHSRFGGAQTIVAHHHAVTIETARPPVHSWIKPSEVMA